MKKNILITGGTGSFGKNFISKILKKIYSKKLLFFPGMSLSRQKWPKSLKMINV